MSYAWLVDWISWIFDLLLAFISVFTIHPWVDSGLSLFCDFVLILQTFGVVRKWFCGHGEPLVVAVVRKCLRWLCTFAWGSNCGVCIQNFGIEMQYKLLYFCLVFIEGIKYISGSLSQYLSWSSGIYGESQVRKFTGGWNEHSLYVIVGPVLFHLVSTCCEILLS